ncbi:MAG: hypothetical protein IJY90_02850 [Clostridia bacterium]|nr:hypothetical protein [Clostridia bacterium]
MKKFLILTVTAGNGHNSCAKSMKNKLESLDPTAEVKIVDLLKTYSTKTRTWIADKGYNIAVSKLCAVYDYFYEQCKRKSPFKRYSCSAMAVAKTTVDKLLKEIVEYQPDVIFCTHFYAGAAVTAIKQVIDLPCKSVITSLDYVNSPFWEACVGVDYFNVPNEDFVQENLDEGFKPQQMLAFGLPVDERTMVETEKSKARAELGIDQNLFTITVMFGGGFWSGGLKIFKNLVKVLGDRKAQIIMINGRSKKGYDKIAKMTFKDNLKVVNVGFTDKVPLYMSASDVMLNKCGGLCATEVINQGLPMLVTEKIPAQEKYNLKYLQEKGGAYSFKNKKQLAENLFKVMDDEQHRQNMSKNLKALRANGISKLAAFMLDLPNADYSKLNVKEIDFDNFKKSVNKALKKADKAERKKAKQA